MERVVGLLFSGFACRAYAVGAAVWIASEAAGFISSAFGAIGAGF